MARLLQSRALLWTLLAAPAAWWTVQAAGMAAWDLEELLHPTGELSARLIILALCLTPLALLFPRSRFVRALAARRRAVGVAAFGYAALHTGFYLVALGEADAVIAEALAPGIWPGWAALALMIPLAATSSNAAMRALRSGWKRLQRLAYPAAALSLVHWALVHDDLSAALANFAPLLALQAWRLLRGVRPPSPALKEQL